jgi:hypothetical protein
VKSVLKPDASEIQRFLDLVTVPEQIVELRLLKVHRNGSGAPYTLSGYFSDYDKLSAEAAKHNAAAQGVYVTINPVDASLLARSANRVQVAGKDSPLTTDADITVRHWLPIDFDPVRPRGISATEEEHDLAIQRARDVREALLAEGWPRPILADSGNGGHLLYRIELPAQDNDIVKKCLEALALRFDDERVTVDHSVFNPARIWKLYGTISRKGDCLPGRPHRLARMLETATERVPPELLQELANRAPEEHPQGSVARTAQAFDLEQWIKASRLEVSDPSGWKGGRRWIMPICPWDSNHDNRSAYIIQFPNGAIAAGCLHNGCRGRNWHALRDLVEPGWQTNHRPRVAAAIYSNDWEAPVPLHQFELPSFPTETLPGWLRDFVEALATATQTPVDLAALLALAVVAAACAKKVDVCLKAGYVEPVNIFVVVAMEPGSRKTSVFRKVMEPLEEHERADVARAAPEIARSKAVLKLKEVRLKRLQERAAAAKGTEQDALTAEVEALAAEAAETTIPASPRYIADDCTAERLSTLLRDQGGRIAVMSPEGDVFDLMAGRYSPTAAGNFGVYLKGHAGDALHVDRINRLPEYVERPALTVGLAVQPDVIRGLTEKPGFRGRGLLGRFLYGMPASLMGYRKTNPPPVRDDVRSSYHAAVRALLEIPLPEDTNGESSPHELSLSTAAQARMQGFDAWIEPQLAEFGALGTLKDWAGKLVGAVGRIAGILHMATYAGAPAPWDELISRETVDNAIQIGKYLIPHAKAAYAEMGADVCVDQAKRILRWIEQNGPTSFTKRDVHQALRGTFKRVEELERPLEILSAHYYIRKQEAAREGPGRRPSPPYLVNPIWVAQRTAWSGSPAVTGHSEDSEDCEYGGASAAPTPVPASANAPQATENGDLA